MRGRPLSRAVVLVSAVILVAALAGYVAGPRANAAPPTPPTPQNTAAGGGPVATHTPAKPLTLPAPAVRMKFQDFVKDPNRLNALIKAVKVMKDRSKANPASADYRTSWEYWSAMHGFYGPDAKAGLIQDAINDSPPAKQPFFKGLRDLVYPAQPPGLAAQVWDQCQHGTPSFLTWHRMFLYYFERVLQGAANDKSLRLPYWDYTDPAQIQLPAQFAQAKLSGGADNPLFDPRRRSQTVQLNPNQTNVDKLLKKTAYSSFSSELEQQPHGSTHCTVGPDCPYPLMGDVPVAATDAIFWLHHANIDRIFECWLKEGGAVPDSLKGQTFAFVDENGALVKLKFSELPIDYVYDHVDNCGRKPTKRFTATPESILAAQPATSVGKVQSFQIGDASAAVALPLAKSGPPADILKHSLLAPAGPARTELVLDDITVEKSPGVLFDVYLSTVGANPRRQYVATISFFNMGHHGKKAMAAPKVSRHIDVTEELKALQGASAEVPQVQVVFEASNGTASSTLQAARGLFNRQSGLRIGTIQLQVKGGS
ncbi:MAG TPA: tyrosinase family protein [Thermoanaerobaculia bacterium]|nr:tyrosinase family protein [Thermoanaerobaculia bacterium]